MKILHTVESYDPCIGGMQEVVKRLSEGLVRLGHTVVVATSSNSNRSFDKLHGVSIEQFDISGNAVRGYIASDQELQRYRDYVKYSDFDVVVNFAAQQWATDLCLPILAGIKAKKVSVLTGFSAFYNPDYSGYFSKMKDWVKEYDANVFLSNDYVDINFARANGAKNIKIIPNGASSEEFSAASDIDVRKDLGLKADTFLILTVGSHTTLKGHKESIKVYKDAQLPNSALLIIGNSANQRPKSDYGIFKCIKMYAKSWILGWNEYGCEEVCNRAERLSPDIFSKNWSREKTVQAFKQADIFLFLSNIECSPIVLFEAMAGHTAFLATDVGNAPEIVDWSGGGTIAPTLKKGLYSYADIKKTTSILQVLYRDKGWRDKLAQSGHDAWRDRYTWEKIVGQYAELYTSL